MTLALTDADQLTSLPAIARGFAERMPRAHLRVVSVDVLVATGGLEGTEVDLVIGPPDPADADLHHEPLYEEEGTLVARRDHPRVKARLSPARFDAERHVDALEALRVHIALGRGGRGHKMAEAAQAERGLVRDIAVTVPTFTAAAWLAAATDLLAGIPRRLAESLATSLPIRVLSGPLPRLPFTIGMSWHGRTDGDAAATCLRDVVRCAFGR